MFCNALNLQLKINTVIKSIFTAFVVSVIVSACGNRTGEPAVVTVPSIEEKQNENWGKLVYLDTAENIYNILCQDWVLEDDAESLEGMDESSQFEIPYRSFYFSTKGSFVKNPRNTFDYGNWSFDDAAKT